MWYNSKANEFANRGYGSVGRASRSQCEGQGFESPYLHQKISYKCTIFFYVKITDSHDFIVVLLCNMNPCGLTLRYVNKFTIFAITEVSRYTSYESPYLHHKKDKLNPVRLVFLYRRSGDLLRFWKIATRHCRVNLFGCMRLTFGSNHCKANPALPPIGTHPPPVTFRPVWMGLFCITKPPDSPMVQ